MTLPCASLTVADSATVEALSRDHRVYAIDLLGDAGRSVPLDPDQNLATGYSAFAWIDDDHLVAYRDSDDSVVTMAATRCQ